MEKQIHDANSPGKLLEVLESIRQLMRSSPYELGIDSLIAVDIQSWFRKVVGIEVPVLEVLNAETLRHLLSLVTSKMPLTTETVPIPGRPSDCSDEDFISDGSGFSVASDMKSFQDDTIQTVSTPDLTESSDTDCGSKPGDDRSGTGLGITAEFQHLSNQPLLARAIPMSFAQSRFWFLNFLVEDQSAFTVTTSIQLRGYVDSLKLNRALQTVGERHEALRTIFYTDEFTNKHMQGADENVLEMTRHKFDLAHGESLRLKLLSMSAQKHHLIIVSASHIDFPLVVHEDFDTLRSLGLYLNLLPVRFRADENDDFITALGAIKTSSEMALGNSNVPFDVILNALDVPRDTSRTPLFQALFNYRPRIEDSRSFLGCNADGMLVSGGENAYDVSVDITDSNTGEVIVVLSVNSGLYTVGDATLLQNTYVKFLQEFVQDPTLKIARPPFMDEDIQKAIKQGRG
ncbi:putative secondary metabolism biosynthetic enzyme [Diatrype stigma]|uniref:Secondary metabolism biosynthetic enzyme n=1 Tax=Diatrype stigma TaxID=117547 RepID=A0AAN9UYC5_9PEZI